MSGPDVLLGDALGGRVRFLASATHTAWWSIRHRTVWHWWSPAQWLRMTRFAWRMDGKR